VRIQSSLRDWDEERYLLPATEVAGYFRSSLRDLATGCQCFPALESAAPPNVKSVSTLSAALETLATRYFTSFIAINDP
jgi:hypothetical protein